MVSQKVIFMPANKKYLIEILIKKMGIESLMSNSIENVIRMLFDSFPNISMFDLQEIKNNYTIEKYKERIIPIFDKNFSEEEIRELMRFYGSSIGQKIVNSDFSVDIHNINKKIASEIEQRFSTINERNKKSNSKN
jgi:hypothetical protein